MAPLASGYPRRLGAPREQFSGPCIGEDTVAVGDEAIASVGNVKRTTWPSATRRSSSAIIGGPGSTPPSSGPSTDTTGHTYISTRNRDHRGGAIMVEPWPPTA